MYVRYVRRHLVGTKTEAELLVELLTSWSVLLQSSPDSFDRVGWPDCRRGVRLDKVDMHFHCEGRGVFLSPERAIHVSMDCYNTTCSWNFEF